MSTLGIAILHCLVSGTIVAVVAVVIAERCRSAATRHAVELGGLFAIAIAFAVHVFAGVEPSASLSELRSWSDVRSSGSGAWAQLGSTIIGTAYAIAVLLLALRLALGARAVARLRRSATLLPGAWVHRIETLARELGLARSIDAAASDRIDTPMVIGCWRPLVLVPAGWVLRLEADAVEAVLLHELWHVRRHDVLLGWLQAALEVLLCFHPAAWWLSRRARRSREHCCDDAAAARCGPRRLAHALLRAEELRSELAFPVPTGACGALPPRRFELRDRIARLVGREVLRTPRRWIAAALLALVALGLSAPAGGPAGEIGIPWLPARVRAWEAELVAAGERHGVDPELLAIVALVESGGDPDAMSPVGAQGLLQVMPATASDIAKQRGLPTPQLLEPDENIDFGAYYLAQQLEAFDRVELAAAAYNGGPTRVRSWLAGRARLPRETERYRELVSALYRERHDPWSPTFARLAARRGLL